MLVPLFFLNDLVSLTDDGENNYFSKLIAGAAVEGNALIVSSTYRCHCLVLKLRDSEDLDSCVFGARVTRALAPAASAWGLVRALDEYVQSLHAAVQNLFALNMHSTAGNSRPAVISVPLCLV